MTEDNEGLKERLARQGEEALGKFAQDLLENPIVTSALTRAFEARERAVQAQEAAMGALNLPSAADLERLTRRIRSVAQRLEGVEDSLDRLDRRLEGIGEGPAAADRLERIEEQLAKIAAVLESGAAAAGKPASASKSVPAREPAAAGKPASARKAAPARKPAARKPAARKPSAPKAS